MSATEVSVRLHDEGQAPDVIAEGFGLRSLRERAELLGGQFWARPAAIGFEIGARLPITARPQIESRQSARLGQRRAEVLPA